MKVTALGTGDVVGTPKIGCDCPVCGEAKEMGKQRLRTSLLIEHKGQHILIDTGSDMRAQLLAADSPRIDAVIWTHGHYDHFMGFGDSYRVQREPISVYGAPEVLYDHTAGGSSASSVTKNIRSVFFEPIKICGIEVTLFPVVHDIPTYGVRITADGKTFVYSCEYTCRTVYRIS